MSSRCTFKQSIWSTPVTSQCLRPPRLVGPIIVKGKIVGEESTFYGRVGLDGKPYAPYGPLVAVLAVPHHLAGRAFAAMMGIPRAARAEGSAWLLIVGGITMLASATAAALAVVGFHRASIALATHARTALLLSMLLGGATVLWPYGTSLFSEAFVAACFVWAAVFLIDARTAIRPAPRIAMATALIVIAGLTKFTSLVFAPAFVVAILAERSISAARRWQIASIVAGAILFAAALHLGWNAYRFGLPFEFGYDWSGRIRVMPPRVFAIDEMPRGVAVLLFAPGKSLFVWAPMLVLSLLNAGSTWRRDRALCDWPADGNRPGPAAVRRIPVSRRWIRAWPAPPRADRSAAGAGRGRACDRARTRNRSSVPAPPWASVMALPATAVSYLEDQALRFNRAGSPVPGLLRGDRRGPGPAARAVSIRAHPVRDGGGH